jgi:hypothetical protein
VIRSDSARSRVAAAFHSTKSHLIDGRQSHAGGGDRRCRTTSFFLLWDRWIYANLLIYEVGRFSACFGRNRITILLHLMDEHFRVFDNELSRHSRLDDGAGRNLNTRATGSARRSKTSNGNGSVDPPAWSSSSIVVCSDYPRLGSV